MLACQGLIIDLRSMHLTHICALHCQDATPTHFFFFKALDQRIYNNALQLTGHVITLKALELKYHQQLTEYRIRIACMPDSTTAFCSAFLILPDI